MQTGKRKLFEAQGAFADAVLDFHRRLHDRANPAGRAARAKLRRCADESGAILERDAIRLVTAVRSDAQVLRWEVDDLHLLRLAPLLAWLEKHDGRRPLPEQFAQPRGEGSTTPRLSELRFRRLLESEGADFSMAMRRALQLLDEPGDVLSLSEAVCDWDHPDHGSALKRRWAFQYYGSLPDARKTKNKS